MGIGFKELLVILIIVIVVFGAKRLRTIGTDLGAALKGFRQAMKEGEDATGKESLDEKTGRTIDVDVTKEKDKV